MVWTGRSVRDRHGRVHGTSADREAIQLLDDFLYTLDEDRRIVHERRVYDFSRMLLQLAGEAEPATEGRRLYREMLERAQREHELRIAAGIQHALLPASRYMGEGFEVAATSVPCRAIGGDFFDYFTCLVKDLRWFSVTSQERDHRLRFSRRCCKEFLPRTRIETAHLRVSEAGQRGTGASGNRSTFATAITPCWTGVDG